MGVFARRYGADGQPLGGEFLVNTVNTGGQSHGRPAMLSDGSFVVVWYDAGTGGSCPGVKMRFFANNGTPSTGELIVPSDTTDCQRAPEVAMAPDGTLAVVWVQNPSSGSDREIYARLFNQVQPFGDQFHVNTQTVGDQDQPRIAMGDDGRIVIVWQSANIDGDDFGVFGQRYLADGTPDGGEFQVNSYTTGPQTFPTVTKALSGGFVVTWQSPDQDGSGLGSFAQRFDALGTPVGLGPLL